MIQKRSVLDIPIFHKIYELYKLLHNYRATIPKADRYTLWQRCENITIIVLETLVSSGHQKEELRICSLYIISDKIDLLKVFIRLAKDTHTINLKQYLTLQTMLQEIGKMIGGWIKSVSH